MFETNPIDRLVVGGRLKDILNQYQKESEKPPFISNEGLTATGWDRRIIALQGFPIQIGSLLIYAQDLGQGKFCSFSNCPRHSPRSQKRPIPHSHRMYTIGMAEGKSLKIPGELYHYLVHHTEMPQELGGSTFLQQLAELLNERP